MGDFFMHHNPNLSDEQKRVMFERGTEPPFSGNLVAPNTAGEYACANCGAPLFAQTAKFESGTGWPSFDQAIPGAVVEVEDSSHGMRRIEVSCAQCGAHLGHVFPDGPTETGQRYCINSVCLGGAKNDTNTAK